jgi:hypothetical protein
MYDGGDEKENQRGKEGQTMFLLNQISRGTSALECRPVSLSKNNPQDAGDTA